VAPRSDEPRRDTSMSRRGASRAGGGRDTGGRGAARTDAPGDGSEIGGISDARAYTPRGRTVREAAESAPTRRGGGGESGGSRRTPRSTRSGDPFRPALQVLDGGRTNERTAARGGVRATGAGRTVVSRSPGGADVAKPAGPRRRNTGAARRPAGPAGRRPSRKPPRPPKLADPVRRLRLGTLLALVVFASIGIRLVELQLVRSPAFADAGLADRLRTTDIRAPRGSIYDRSGAPLAHSVEAKYVFADPEMIDDPGRVAEALSPLLGIPRSELAKRMARQKLFDGRQSRFEYLARGVEIDNARKVMALNLPGIGVDRDERREVPGGDLAANLIGFTNREMTGLEGIEARYDNVLRGVTGRKVSEVGQGALDAEIPGGYSRITTPAQPGSSLTLTIDRDLQYFCQRVLSEQAKERSGSTGAAVVIDIRTGEVLAQASQPTYDAADWQGSDPVAREDVATSFVVDPGSVHKAITFGAALQEGVIKPDTTIPVPSGINKGGTTFVDHIDARGRRMTLPGMLAYSSNVGTIKIADELGPEKLYEYQRKFGLGRATGEGVPGEAEGRLLAPKDWSGSSYGSVPIGHSVDATPLQMAAAYAAIANNGTWVQPHLIKETIAPDGTRTPAAAPVTRPVLSPANAAALRTMLEAVTTMKDATGLKAAIPGYRVAGKTGTGARLVDGKYVPGEVASFIGMAPADNPRYVVAVFAHTPNGEGGDISAPAFNQIMTFALTHYRIPPTGAAKPSFVAFP
jgi:cell division protein FtsI (penicillin-binding protein 3)